MKGQPAWVLLCLQLLLSAHMLACGHDLQGDLTALEALYTACTSSTLTAQDRHLDCSFPGVTCSPCSSSSSCLSRVTAVQSSLWQQAANGVSPHMGADAAMATGSSVLNLASSMDQLVELQLSNCGLRNHLTGQVPLWSSTEVPDLQSVNLSHNQFTGSIPAIWCISGGSGDSAGPLTQYDVRGNAGLQGPVPSCLLHTQQLLADTSLTGDSGGAADAGLVGPVEGAGVELAVSSVNASSTLVPPTVAASTMPPSPSSTPSRATANGSSKATVAAANATAPASVPASPAPAPPSTITITQQDGSSTAGVKMLAWALPVVAVLCLLVGAAISLWLMHRHQRRLKQQERERMQEHKMLKQLMYALTDGGSNPGFQHQAAYLHAAMPPGPGPTMVLPQTATSNMAGGAIIGPLPGTAVPDTPLAGMLGQPADSLRVPSMYALGGSHTGMHGLPHSMSTRDALQHTWASSKAFAFVVTDVEGSTQLSATAGPALSARLQEIHDNIMRELIAKYGGLEVGTEGDSFTVAFTSVAPATAFCMEVQYKLLDTAWPAACLKLPPCKPIRGPGGQVQMAGLRVRMGIHWAGEGTVAHRLHPLTKQRVFEGPGLQTAQELGDCAHGGQVLLSHEAWLMLRAHMAYAGFPVVRCLGLYQLESMPAPSWLYHVTELVGKPLNRSFGPPRGVRTLWNPHVPKTSSNTDALSNRSKPRYNILASLSATASSSRAAAQAHTGLATHGPAVNTTTAPVSSLPPPTQLAGSTGGHGSQTHGPAQQAPPSHWDLRCVAPPGVATLAAPAQAAALAFAVCRIVPAPVKRFEHKLPSFMAAKLEEVLAIQAQQFRGYLYDAGPANPSCSPHSGTSVAATPTGTQPGTNGSVTSIGPLPLSNSVEQPAPTGSAQGGDAQHMVFSITPGGAAPAVVSAGPSAGALSTAGASLTPVVSLSAGKGSVLGSGSSCGWWRLAFESATDALRFCHAAQMALMYIKCPHQDSSCQAWLWEQVLGPDGRPLFQGARFAMALHHSHEYEAVLLPSPAPGPELPIVYAGLGPSFCDALAATVHGGQVVLTEAAWEQVKTAMVAHPGAVVALSLGSHVISPAWPTPHPLMEVMPNLLAKRRFKSLATHMQTQPGYHDAPSVDKPLAIVFVKVQKPTAVVRAQQMGVGSGDDASSMGDDELLRTIMAYHMAVNQYTAVARQLLAAYGGYECKEPEPGKFTLAFQTLEQAIGWAAQLQHELLAVNWPPALATMSDCAKEYDSQGQLLWSGLRLRTGMAYGYISSKKPLNTGRADYFGVLANTAARVCAMAAPGQVLIDCSDPKAQPQGLDGLPLLRERVITRLGLTWAPVTHDLQANAGVTSPETSVSGGPLASASGIDADTLAHGPPSTTSSQQQSLQKYTGPVSFASMLAASQEAHRDGPEGADAAPDHPASPASQFTHRSASHDLPLPDLGMGAGQLESVQSGMAASDTSHRRLSIVITDSMRQRAPQTPRVVLSAGNAVQQQHAAAPSADALDASSVRLVQSAQEQRRSLPPGLPLGTSNTRQAATTRAASHRVIFDGVNNAVTVARPGATQLAPGSADAGQPSSSSGISPTSQLLHTIPSASSPVFSVSAPSPAATSSASPHATGAVVVSRASHTGTESLPASPATLTAVAGTSSSRSPASSLQANLPVTPRTTHGPGSCSTNPPSPSLPMPPPAPSRMMPVAAVAAGARASVSFTSPQRQVSLPMLAEGSHSGPILRAAVQRSTSAGQDFAPQQGHQQQRHGLTGRDLNQQRDSSGDLSRHMDAEQNLTQYEAAAGNEGPGSKDGSDSTDKLMPLRVASSVSRMAGGAVGGLSMGTSVAAGLPGLPTAFAASSPAQSSSAVPEHFGHGFAGAQPWLDLSGGVQASSYISAQPGSSQQHAAGRAVGTQAPAKLAYDDIVELRPLGWFLLRGLHNPKLLFEARPVSLAGRNFPEPAGPYQPSTPLVGRRPRGTGDGFATAAPGSAMPPGMWHGAAGAPMPPRRAAQVATRLLGIGSIGTSLRSLLSKALGSSTLPSTTPSSFVGAGMLASQEGQGDVEMGRYGSPYPPSDDPTHPRDRWSAAHSLGLLPLRGHATEPGHPTERATWHAGTKPRPQHGHSSQHAQTHHSSRQLSVDSGGTSQLDTPSGSGIRMPAGALGVVARPFAVPMHAAAVPSMHHGGTGASTSTQFSAQTDQPPIEPATGPSRQQLAAVYSAVGRAATRSVAGKSGLRVLAKRAMAIAGPGADSVPSSATHAGATTGSGSTPTTAMTPAATSLPSRGPERAWAESSLPDASAPATQLGQQPASIAQPAQTAYRELLASNSSRPGSSTGWGDAPMYPGSSNSSRQGSQANMVPALSSSGLGPAHPNTQVSRQRSPGLAPGTASSAGAAATMLMPDPSGWSGSWIAGSVFSSTSMAAGTTVASIHPPMPAAAAVVAASAGLGSHLSTGAASAGRRGVQAEGMHTAPAGRTGFRPATTRMQQSTSGVLSTSLRVGSPLGVSVSTPTSSVTGAVRVPSSTNMSAAAGLSMPAGEDHGVVLVVGSPDGQQAAAPCVQTDPQQPEAAAEVAAQDVGSSVSQRLDVVQLPVAPLDALPNLPPLRRLPRAEHHDQQPGDEAVTSPRGMSMGSMSLPGSPCSSPLPPEHQPQASPGASLAHAGGTGSTDSSPNSALYGRPGANIPTRHNYGLLAPQQGSQSGLLGHAASPTGGASGSTLLTRLFRQPAKLLGRSSKEAPAEQTSGQSAPSLNLMQRFLQRSMTSGVSSRAPASTGVQQQLQPRSSRGGNATSEVALTRDASTTTSEHMEQWHCMPVSTAAGLPAVHMAPAAPITMQQVVTRPAGVAPSHGSFTSESVAASSSPQVAQQLTRLQGHYDGSGGYLGMLISRSGINSSLDSSGQHDLDNIIQHQPMSAQTWLQSRTSRSSMQQRLLHSLHASGEHSASGVGDMAGASHVNRAQVGGDSFASGRTTSSRASGGSHQASGQHSITVKARSSSRNVSGSGNNSMSMQPGITSHPGSEYAGSALGSVTVAASNSGGRGGIPSSLQHATTSASMIPHSQSMHSLFGGDLTAALATVDSMGVAMPTLQDADISSAMEAGGTAVATGSRPAQHNAVPIQGHVVGMVGQTQQVEQPAKDDALPPLKPRRSAGGQQQYMQAATDQELYQQHMVQFEVPGQQQLQPSYQQLVHQLPVHQEVRGGSRDRVQLFVSSEVAGDDDMSGLMQVGPTPSIHSQRSRYNLAVNESGISATAAQLASGQANTSTAHQSSSLARSQREYAAEVAATYLAQRYTRKLSGWAPATLPVAGLDATAGAQVEQGMPGSHLSNTSANVAAMHPTGGDSGVGSVRPGMAGQASHAQVCTQYHVVPGSLPGVEGVQQAGTPVSLTPAGSLSAADALPMPFATTTAAGGPLSRTSPQHQVVPHAALLPASTLLASVAGQQLADEMVLAGQLPTELTLRVGEQLELAPVAASENGSATQPTRDADAAQDLEGNADNNMLANTSAGDAGAAASNSVHLTAASSILGAVPAPAGTALPSIPSRLSRVQHWLQSGLEEAPMPAAAGAASESFTSRPSA